VECSEGLWNSFFYRRNLVIEPSMIGSDIMITFIGDASTPVENRVVSCFISAVVVVTEATHSSESVIQFRIEEQIGITLW
jgi:hypothetical protein